MTNPGLTANALANIIDQRARATLIYRMPPRRPDLPSVADAAAQYTKAYDRVRELEQKVKRAAERRDQLTEQIGELFRQRDNAYAAWEMLSMKRNEARRACETMAVKLREAL